MIKAFRADCPFVARLSENRSRLAGLRHFRDGSRIHWLSAWADAVDAAVVERVAA